MEALSKVIRQGKNQRTINVPKKYWDYFPVGKMVKIVPVKKVVLIEEK